MRSEPDGADRTPTAPRPLWVGLRPVCGYVARCRREVVVATSGANASGAAAAECERPAELVDEAEEVQRRRKNSVQLDEMPLKLRLFLLDRCRQHVPGWADASLERLVVEPLHGGLTNKLFKLAQRDGAEGCRPVVVRFFGIDTGFFSREQEIVVSQALSDCGFNRATNFHVFREFGGGRLEAFLDGRTLSWVDLSDPKISLLVAEVMASLHDTSVPIGRQCKLFENLHHWLNRVKKLPVKSELTVAELEDAVSFLTERLKRLDAPVCFCHNDVQEGNILLDEASGLLQLIDFEYGSYNFREFDIANHMCEHYIDNAHKQPPFFKLDVNRFPSREHQLRFIQHYLKSRPNGAAERKDSAEAVLERTQWFMLASHLQWALWALIMSVASTIQFDYVKYAEERIAEFRRLRALLERGKLPV